LPEHRTSCSDARVDVLVIGGSRFVGRQLAHRLVLRGDRVTLLNRGTHDDGLGDRVSRLIADRTTDALDHALADRRFDAAIDFSAYVASDVERAVRALDGRVGHYVFVGTGQVYLVREGAPSPAREEDADGPLIAAPDDPRDREGWAYGVGKREAEEVLARAFAERGFPATRLRIPMVHGPGDPYRRIARILERLRADDPVLVPSAHARVRHVHGPSIASIFAALLGDARMIGRALNVAPAESTTVLGVFERIAHHTGSRAHLLPIDDDELLRRGLRAEDLSPIGGRWMSLLDPTRAIEELGIEHPPIDDWLPGVVDAAIASG
jgi:nucleoside-diphosphate-sugar epimerase